MATEVKQALTVLFEGEDVLLFEYILEAAGYGFATGYAVQNQDSRVSHVDHDKTKMAMRLCSKLQKDIR